MKLCYIYNSPKAAKTESFAENFKLLCFQYHKICYVFLFYLVQRMHDFKFCCTFCVQFKIPIVKSIYESCNASWNSFTIYYQTPIEKTFYWKHILSQIPTGSKRQRLGDIAQ